MKKYAFFIDIDGTLVDKKREVNPGNIAAVNAAREAGCKVFINTGRGRACIPSEIRALPWDGVVSGCGCLLDYNGETVFSNCPDYLKIYEYLKEVEKNGERCFLEGNDMIFRFNCPESAKKTDEIFARYNELGRLNLDDWTPLSCAEEILKYPGVQIPKFNLVGKYDKSVLARFSRDYDGVVDDYKCELYTKGGGKAAAMMYVMENILTGYTCVALGDGVNDVDALKAADFSATVSGASPEVIKMCGYVSPLTADEGGAGDIIMKFINPTKD